MAERSFALTIVNSAAHAPCAVVASNLPQLQLAVQASLGLGADVHLTTWDADFQEALAPTSLDAVSTIAAIQLVRVAPSYL